MAVTKIEKENLEAHVELSSERYKQIDARLTAIEDKVNNLQKTLEENNLSTFRVLVGTAGTIIVGILALFGVILTAAV